MDENLISRIAGTQSYNAGLAITALLSNDVAAAKKSLVDQRTSANDVPPTDAELLPEIARMPFAQAQALTMIMRGDLEGAESMLDLLDDSAPAPEAPAKKAPRKQAAKKSQVSKEPEKVEEKPAAVESESLPQAETKPAPEQTQFQQQPPMQPQETQIDTDPNSDPWSQPAATQNFGYDPSAFSSSEGLEF